MCVAGVFSTPDLIVKGVIVFFLWHAKGVHSKPFYIIHPFVAFCQYLFSYAVDVYGVFYLRHVLFWLLTNKTYMHLLTCTSNYFNPVVAMGLLSLWTWGCSHYGHGVTLIMDMGLLSLWTRAYSRYGHGVALIMAMGLLSLWPWGCSHYGHGATLIMDMSYSHYGHGVTLIMAMGLLSLWTWGYSHGVAYNSK